MTKHFRIMAVMTALFTIACLVCGCTGGGDRYEKNISNVKLGKYKGLPYHMASTKVTKSDIQERIDTDRQASAKSEEIKSGVVENGYAVTMDYTGKVKGKTFDGSSGKDYVVTVGQSGLPFDQNLVGMKIGDKANIEVKLPEDYQDSSVAGKKAKYEIHIKSATKYTPPKYDDKFVESKGYKNKKEYEKALKKEIAQSKKDSAILSAKEELLSLAIYNAEIKKIPEDLVDYEYEKSLKVYKKMAKEYDVSWEDFLENYVKSSEKELKENLKASAEASVKEKLVIAAIAHEENIKADGEEYEEYLSDILNRAGLTEDTFKQQYNQEWSEYIEDNDFASQYLKEKVSEILFKEGKEEADN